MADSCSGNLVFVRATQRKVVFLPSVPTLAALQTYANEIKVYSNAGIDVLSYVQTNRVHYPEGAGNLEDPDLIARVMLRNTDPAKKDYPQVVIPAPRTENFEFIEGKGYRLKQAIGEAIAAIYSTLTGETYEFRHGWIC